MKLLKAFLAIAMGGMMLLSVPAWADADAIGKLEYQKNCAACHGADGKGNGPFLDYMKQTPPDLTLISQRNGGSYPFKQIYNWIEDPTGIRAHGSNEMPIWGERYSRAVIEKYGPLDTAHSGMVQARILELVFYLANLQQ